MMTTPEKTILGIDLGGAKTAVVHATASGEIRNRAQFATGSQRGVSAWLDDVRAAADGMDASSPTVVSIAVGGPMDEQGGVLIAPPHLPGFEDAPLGEQLSTAFGAPCRLMHDARAGAYAEYRFGLGVARGARRLGFLTFGTGFGCGVVLDGQLLDIPGEVGHWRVAEDGPALFGKAGSLEGLASGAGILAQARAQGLLSADGGDLLADAAALADKARSGDAAARATYKRAAVEVGRQCARLIDLFGLDAIALGTIATRAGDLVMETVRETVRAEALPHLAERCAIEAAGLGDDLGDKAALSAALAAGLPTPTTATQGADLARSVAWVLGDRELLAAIDGLADRVVAILAGGGKLLTAGNGGSATDAAHLSEELVGRYRGERRALPAICLATDGAAMTCIVNDYGYKEVFSRQVEALARPGDLFVAFTTSGNSANINLALEAARAQGVETAVITGKTGGEAKTLADHVVLIPGSNTARIQELHTLVLHVLCEAVEQRWA